MLLVKYFQLDHPPSRKEALPTNGVFPSPTIPNIPRTSKYLCFQKHKYGKDTDVIMEDIKVADNEGKVEEVKENLNSFRMNTAYATVTIKLPKNSDFIKYLHKNTPSSSTSFSKQTKNF